MKIPEPLLRTANGLLSRWNLQVSRCAQAVQTSTMAGVLERIAGRGVKVGTVIDVGAAQGKWAGKAMRYFPDARYLLVEPLVERKAELEALKQRCSNLDYVLAVAGASQGEVRMHISEDLDGSGVSDSTDAAGRVVPVTTLDLEVARLKLPAPYFVKLDTHGFELPILEGARETLALASVVAIEVYNFQLTKDSLRFHEMVAHMESLGFRVSDLADPMPRKKDGVLWQMDLFFERKDQAVFQYPHYA